MDPFSITLGVISLIGTSAKIIATLKDTVDSSRGIDRRLQMLISDVEMFKAMLESMKGTLESKEVRPLLLHAAGNLNSHWNTISVCIQDGEKMMSEFAVMLEKIDKSVDFMDAIRKLLRLKSSWEDISVFQTQLSSCRETISVSLHAVLIWNQVLSKDQNVFGGPLFLPVLSDLTAAIRRLAEDVNERMKVLENCVDSRDTESEMSTLNNMKNCVQSSAKIASTASSWALSTDAAESVAASDLYDIWPVQPDPNTLAWVASTSNIDLIRASVRSIPIISFSAADQSDSDDEMEAEIANIHMKRGREELLLGNFATAERYLQRGVRRLRSSRSQRQNLAVHADGLENLVTLYREQERWEETKDTIIERLALLSRTATADSTEVLKERLALADVLLKLHDPVQARLHARTCIKAYRKLGPPGHEGLKDSLSMMIEICSRENDIDGEEEHRLLLSNISPSLDADDSSLWSQTVVGTSLHSDSGSFTELTTDDTTPPAFFQNPTKQLMPRRKSSDEEERQSSDGITQASWNPGITTSNERCSQTKSPVPSDPNHPILTDYPFATLKTQIIASTDDSNTSSQLETSNSPDIEVMETFSQSHHRSVSNPEASLQNDTSIGQARTKSTQHIRLSVESPREGTIDNSSGIERLKSNSCSNLNANFNQSAIDSEQSSFRIKTDKSTPLLPRVRAIFVGSACSGKTSLISRYFHGSQTLTDINDCTRALIPQFKACSIQLGSETVSVELVLWDSPGPMSETLFPDTIHNIADTINCIVLCFAVDEPDLIPDLDTLWAPRLRTLFPNRPVILVGTKIDLRTTGELHRVNQPCDHREGIQIQDRIRAVSYVDCSAKTGEGVDQLMREVVLFSMKHRERMAELGRVKSIWRKGMGWLRSKP